MARNSDDSDDDYPSLGQCRRGRIFVCHGDDRPTEFVGWLREFASRFSGYRDLADERGVKLFDPVSRTHLWSVTEFCEAIGVDVSGNSWEGQCVSGVYRLGWVKKGRIRAAQVRGRALLRLLERQVEEGVRESIFEELREIEDIDELIERTRNDRWEMQADLRALREKVTDLNVEVKSLQNAAQTATKENSGAIDRGCLRIACTVLDGTPQRMMAGPVLMWDDGVIYAFVNRGGVPLPPASSPSRLLETLTRRGCDIVRVQEMTLLGGWTRGPNYRRGSEHISEWLTIWFDSEKQERKFIVDPPERQADFEAVYRALRDKSACEAADSPDV